MMVLIDLVILHQHLTDTVWIYLLKIFTVVDCLTSCGIEFHFLGTLTSCGIEFHFLGTLKLEKLFLKLVPEFCISKFKGWLAILVTLSWLNFLNHVAGLTSQNPWIILNVLFDMIYVLLKKIKFLILF